MFVSNNVKVAWKTTQFQRERPSSVRWQDDPKRLMNGWWAAFYKLSLSTKAVYEPFLSAPKTCRCLLRQKLYSCFLRLQGGCVLSNARSDEPNSPVSNRYTQRF